MVVACLSLIAKVKIYVPVFLDLEAAMAKVDREAEVEYMFEAKIMRWMELLVFFALG